MTSSDPNPKNLFPAHPTRTENTRSGTGPAFATPGAVEFPAETSSEDEAMTAFGSRVQADQDPDLLDVNISHVRDVHVSQTRTRVRSSDLQTEATPIPVVGPPAHAMHAPVPEPHPREVHIPAPGREPQRRKFLLIALALAAVAVVIAELLLIH